MSATGRGRGDSFTGDISERTFCDELAPQCNKIKRSIKESKSSTSWLPVLGETGEAKEGDMALLAVSDRDPGGDELIRSGATAPSATEPRGGQFHGLRYEIAHDHTQQTPKCCVLTWGKRWHVLSGGRRRSRNCTTKQGISAREEQFLRRCHNQQKWQLKEVSMYLRKPQQCFTHLI